MEQNILKIQPYPYKNSQSYVLYENLLNFTPVNKLLRKLLKYFYYSIIIFVFDSIIDNELKST